MKKIRFSILIVVLIISAFLLRGKISHKNFNSEVWKTANLNSEENWSLRWDMMNDLRNRYKLVGMNRKEINNLLGNAEDTTSSELSYYLGYSKSGINTGTLIIKFNTQNIATMVKVKHG